MHIHMVCYLQYYYSIKDISIGGRCVCNGHADTCDTPGPDDRLICTCSHNTCGSECEICCPGFVQKKWKPATLEDSNECERMYNEVLSNSLFSSLPAPLLSLPLALPFAYSHLLFDPLLAPTIPLLFPFPNFPFFKHSVPQ